MVMMIDSEDPTAQVQQQNMYDIRSNDPSGELLNVSDMPEEDIEQISRLMQALGDLREAERRASDASAKYMALNDTDMRALHFLIVCENQARPVTASLISAHLAISPATTTKLLDRLERGRHITRHPHPTDRRSLTIQITPETRRAAYDTVGRLQSRRFHAAARLSREERDVVISFLKDMTAEIDMKHADWARDD